MRKASQLFKESMKKHIRNRGYISVGLGIVNEKAQENASINSQLTYWSDKAIPFSNNQVSREYATMEQDFFKADGSMLFVPRENDVYVPVEVPISTQNILGEIRVELGSVYSIKGLTIDFGEYYPLRLEIKTEEKTLQYDNSEEKFVTQDVLGDIGHFTIVPKQMIGGQQRLRIKSITMGVGLSYTNEDIENSDFEEFVSGISDESPYQKFNISIFDKNNTYNVDDDNSFINFLETGQSVTLSYGLLLDDGTVEWINMANLVLSDWESKKNHMSFSATDLFETMVSEYTIGNKIYERTAYEEAEQILNDAGYEPDQYILDYCLKDVKLKNPMPKGTHRECLQLLANASRCILFQDEDGKICIKANFANVIEPEDIAVDVSGKSDWSKPNNILGNDTVLYADMTRDYFKADGNMYFLPKEPDYLETGFVSEEVSDAVGAFKKNPTISLKLPANYTYYGVYIDFAGNPPKEMLIKTYNGEQNIGSYKKSVSGNHCIVNEEFNNFDKIVFEFTKAAPHDRVLVQKVAFGNLSDYTIRKDDMTSEPIGYREKKPKNVYVKIYTFQNGEDGEAKEQEDDVYVEKTINPNGENRYVENPLIATTEHAELIAEWIGNYYANNVSYDIDYRGDPQICAADIIYLESDVVNNLQVEVETSSFKFNGAFSGALNLRRAMSMMR